MPKDMIKGPADEKAWARAKATVKKSNPGIVEGSKKFMKLVMQLYSNYALEKRPAKSALQEVMASA